MKRCQLSDLVIPVNTWNPGKSDPEESFQYIDLSAVVTMADDGGGSGRLRQDIGMLPPGDIRNCIIALSNIEPTMETLMQHRFKEGSLKGQSFGNLFLAALNEIYGDFELAISKISEILAVRGRVLPVTLEDIHLVAKLANGNLVNGESNIAQECINQSTRIDKILLRPSNVDAFPEVIDRINNSAKRMSNLISDLLEYSRLSNSAEFEEVNLQEIIKDVMLDLEILIQEKKAKIISALKVSLRELLIFWGYFSKSYPHILRRRLNCMDFSETIAPGLIR